MSAAAPVPARVAKPESAGTSTHAGRLLQRKCACGSATSSLTGECEGCTSRRLIQTKLAIGSSNDPLELEADRVADQVMAGPASAPINGAPPRIQRFTGQPGAAAGTAPASVDRVLASPGRPLEPALRHDMEQRFGHDFSRVRVHCGAEAEQSARDVSANAYTNGNDIVFGAGRFAPSVRDGRRLIAHELTHVAQRGAAVIRRDIVIDSASNITGFEFRVGHELTAAFVTDAKRLSADGALDSTDILKLQADIIKARDTVSDHERMFMAALLDAANVGRLQRLRVNATASIIFSLATITDVRMKQVIEAGQPALPASVSQPLNKMRAAVNSYDIPEALKQGSQTATAAEIEIRALIGATLHPKLTAVIAFAQARGILLFNLLVAVQKAASDNAPNDRLLAAAAYATAAAAGHPLAEDLRNGAVHVDALAPAAFLALPGVPPVMRALYMPAASINPKIAGLKGDTIYMPDDFDIDNLYDRSNVIHELRHAQDDKAGPATGSPGSALLTSLEATAYRAQARYILDQLGGQPAAAQATSARQVGATAGDLVLMAVLVETQSDPGKYQPLAVQTFAGAPAASRLPPADVTRLVALPPIQLESFLQRLILRIPDVTPTARGTLDGLTGESLIHWIHRL